MENWYVNDEEAQNPFEKRSWASDVAYYLAILIFIIVICFVLFGFYAVVFIGSGIRC